MFSKLSLVLRDTRLALDLPLLVKGVAANGGGGPCMGFAFAQAGQGLHEVLCLAACAQQGSSPCACALSNSMRAR